MLDLKKVIAEDSLRGIGRDYNNVASHKTIIAGNDFRKISEAMELKSYRFKRIKIENAFIISDGEKIFYIYVKPTYRGYRKLFSKFVEKIPDGYHVDHILARNLGTHYRYNYVLLCMIPGGVNKKNGFIEKKKIALDELIEIPNLCYMDERIYHKVLSRNPLARQKLTEIKDGYIIGSKLNSGLTLKQKGIWNSTFGFFKSNLKKLIRENYLIEIE